MDCKYHFHSSTLHKFCVGFFFLLLGGSNVTFAQNGNSKETISEEDSAKVDRFFDRYLKMGMGKFSSETSVNIDEVDAAVKKVWKIWVQSNNDYSEPKFIELKELDKKNKGRLFLPEKLEPNATMNYYYGIKGIDKKTEEGYPLFLYLHGSGNRNDEWETGFNLCNGFDDAPSVYFIPQIPNVGNYYRWWQKSKQYAWEKLLRLSLVNGEINPNRIYFFGISEGGYGSQRLASFYADYLAGAGPMAGGEPLINAPAENCANLAFSLLTGEFDDGFYRNRLTKYIDEAFNKLEKEHNGHFKHRVELVPKAYHGFDYRPTTPWLAKNVRDPHPKMVLWENYNMDGLKRKGFYNLFLENDPAGRTKDRIYYEMHIAGNDITLNVNKVEYRTIESQQGIALKFERTYNVVNKGIVRIYLNDKLVDLTKPVKVIANGKVLFNGTVEPNLKDMVNSCATFYDPERIFPTSVTVDLSQEETGVKTIECEPTSMEVFYDLNGRKTEHPQKGIFINHKGQKVLFQ